MFGLMDAKTAMGEFLPDTIHRWSTVDVLPGRRLDHYAEMLTEAIDPDVCGESQYRCV